MSRLSKQLLFGKHEAPSKAGCKCGELRRHIESQFKQGMNWENYGLWVLDHITPCSFFEGRDKWAMNHFSNLQPLWQTENTRKSDQMGGISARVLLVERRETLLKRISDFVPPQLPYPIFRDVFVCGGFERQMEDIFVSGGFCK